MGRNAEGKWGSATGRGAAGLSIPALCPFSLVWGKNKQRKTSGKQTPSFGAFSIPSWDSVGFGEPCLVVPDIPLAEFSVSELAGSSPGLVWGDGCSEVWGHYSSSPLEFVSPPLSLDGRREEGDEFLPWKV